MWKILGCYVHFPGALVTCSPFISSTPSPSSSLDLTPCHTWDVFHPSEPIPGVFLQRFSSSTGMTQTCSDSDQVCQEAEAGLARR